MSNLLCVGDICMNTVKNLVSLHSNSVYAELPPHLVMKKSTQKHPVFVLRGGDTLHMLIVFTIQNAAAMAHCNEYLTPTSGYQLHHYKITRLVSDTSTL